MSRVIAIAGKGGVGKTTFASLVIKYLLKNKKSSILAIDGDPNSNLADFLGVNEGKSIVSIIDETSRNISSIPAGMTKDKYLEYRLNSALTESQGFDLLVMGKPEGAGCYCYANNMLRTLIDKMSNAYDYVVIDNEAGMEHLSRRTTRSADILFIISSYTPVGFRSAKRIYDLVGELELKIKKTYLVINQVGERDDSLDRGIEDLAIEVAGFLPQDEEVLKKCINNESLLSLAETSAAFTAIDEILGKLNLPEAGMKNEKHF